MKNLYSKSEFISERSRLLDENKLNEGFGKLLGNLFNKFKNILTKTKGGKELEAVYKQALVTINANIEKQTGIKLNIGAEAPKPGVAPAKPGAAPAKPGVEATTSGATTAESGATNASYSFSKFDKIYEADVAAPATPAAPANPGTNAQPTGAPAGDNKKLAQDFKQRKPAMQKILDLEKRATEKKMNDIFIKYGGEKNPNLKKIMDNYLSYQFEIDFLNAQADYCTNNGIDQFDKSMMSQITMQRDKLGKEAESKLNTTKVDPNAKVQIIDIGGKKLKVGVPYRYKTKDKGIKIVKISKKSNIAGMLIGSYLPGNGKDVKIGTEIDKFSPENFERPGVEFKPEKDKEYNYTNKKGDTNKVKVITGTITPAGNVEVQLNDKKFKVPAGALMDIAEKEPVQNT